MDDISRSRALGGLWLDEPHRVMCAGLVYFLLLAVFQFVMQIKCKRSVIEIQPVHESPESPHDAEPKLSCVPTREKPSRV